MMHVKVKFLDKQRNANGEGNFLKKTNAQGLEFG